jgi:hypothetical protein
MYKKLLGIVNQFVHLRQGAFSRWYEGKIIDVTPDYVDLQTFHANGSPSEVWTLSMDSITELSVGSMELNALSLKVKWAMSPSNDEDETMAHGDKNLHSLTSDFNHFN